MKELDKNSQRLNEVGVQSLSVKSNPPVTLIMNGFRVKLTGEELSFSNEQNTLVNRSERCGKPKTDPSCNMIFLLRSQVYCAGFGIKCL